MRTSRPRSRCSCRAKGSTKFQRRGRRERARVPRGIATINAGDSGSWEGLAELDEPPNDPDDGFGEIQKGVRNINGGLGEIQEGVGYIEEGVARSGKASAGSPCSEA